MPPYQLYTQLRNFSCRQIARNAIRPGNDRQRDELVKYLQRCLVGSRNRLLYPGERGRQAIATWSDAVLAKLANQAAEFMEI